MHQSRQLSTSRTPNVTGRVPALTHNLPLCGHPLDRDSFELGNSDSKISQAHQDHPGRQLTATGLPALVAAAAGGLSTVAEGVLVVPLKHPLRAGSSRPGTFVPIASRLVGTTSV
jgi:hypothetical protein